MGPEIWVLKTFQVILIDTALNNQYKFPFNSKMLSVLASQSLCKDFGDLDYFYRLEI